MSIFKWHQSHWQDDGYLNEAVENFNDLINNKLSPSVHTVDFIQPLDYDMNNKQQDNILVSDISRGEQVKDLKLMHTKLDSLINSGSYIWWNNFPWIVLNEENNSVLSHRTYSIQKCGIEINIQYDGNYYTYPVAITNLTLYADGLKELVNLSVSSAKYSIQIAENEITNTIEVGTRFIIRGRAFEVSLIDDFTTLNVRTLTVCETVINSKDDIENDIAYNDNSEKKEEVNNNFKIVGSNVILMGDTVEYTLPSARRWEMDNNNALVFVVNEEGKCKIKCKSDSNSVGKEVKLRAINNMSATIDEITIQIRGLF